MIDARNESLLTIAAASRVVPGQTGRGVNVSTVWRWMQRGIHGIKLESLLCGGIRYTSHEALQRFFDGTTAAADGQPPAIRTPAARERAIAKAERELAEAGI